MRIQVEEMHVYYFIAKKLISNAKLGFLGIMASSEEKLLNNIYNSWDLEEIGDLTKKLYDKLDNAQVELKINANPQSIKGNEELISEAVSYTSNLLFKPEVLENVKKTLKADLSTHDKIVLCVDKIGQTKRVLMGLSPDERKKVLDGKGLEVNNETKEEKQVVVKAVDEENVANVTDMEVKVLVPESEAVEETKDIVETESVENGESSVTARNVFTAADMPSVPFENIVPGVGAVKEEVVEAGVVQEEKVEEEIEVLDFDEDEPTEVVIEEEVEELDSTDTEAEKIEVMEEEILEDVASEESSNEEVIASEQFSSEVVLREEIVVVPDRVVSIVEDNTTEDITEDVTLEEKLPRETIVVVPDRVVEVEKTTPVVDENTYFEMPTIVKIIERDGVSVDEDIA